MPAVALPPRGLPALLLLGAYKTADVSEQGRPPVLTVSESTGAMPWLCAGFFLLARCEIEKDAIPEEHGEKVREMLRREPGPRARV